MRKNVRLAKVFHFNLYPDFCVIQNPLLPVTVQDQIRLWELERNRLKSQEGATLRAT